MPYIPQEDRKKYKELIEEIGTIVKEEAAEKKAGHLNFIITSILKKVYGDQIRYVTLNEVAGILTCVQLEWNRRITSPYEDKKIQEEGDL